MHTSSARAETYPLLTELQHVDDTCGTAYADNLNSCTPFRCQQPSPMATMFSFPSKAELIKMPPDQQQKLTQEMLATEKKMQSMSSQERDALKAKMVSTLEIKGYDAQGRCQTSTMAIPGQSFNCSLDKATLGNFATYTRQAANADHIRVESESHLENGKMVTTQVDTINGKSLKNPWKEALDSGACKISHASGHPAATDDPIKPEGHDLKTLFILDASGSMWGQVNGKPKITIAKEVMAKLVSELPKSSRIGLIAYGHRRKGDCNDVETLVELGANDKQAVLNAIKGLNAKGKTPLTLSVNMAFKMLQKTKQPATIILVSDGIESCHADPCKTVKAAKEYGVKFILHTVGFGLSEEESAQLQCMAKAGGGQYFQANSAEDLLKSARKAVKSEGSGALKLTLRANGKPVNAWVQLVGQGTIRLADLTNDAGVKPGHIWHLRPGTYQLQTYPAGLRGVDPIQVKNIQIKSGKTVEKVLVFDQAVLRVTATDNSTPAVVEIKIKTWPRTRRFSTHQLFRPLLCTASKRLMRSRSCQGNINWL